MSELNIVQKPSPNHRKQNGKKKTSITLHWMVGSLAGTDRHFANPESKVATHYGIEGNKVHQYVDEKDYAFANGHTKANTHSISIEHEGGQMQKDGTRKKPTKATHETSAKLVAEIAKRHNLGKLEVGKNVFPHKHWVATACPGSLDIEYIVNKANQIIAEEIIQSIEQAIPKPQVAKPQPEPTSNVVVYKVRIGDTLAKIAGRHGTTVKAIQTENNIRNANLIFPGQTLRITKAEPVKAQPEVKAPTVVVYKVRIGDTLAKIAARHGTTVKAIQTENKIRNVNLILPGQTLRITK